MRLFIRHDGEGNIISAMKVNVMAEGLDHPFGELEEGEVVIEVEPTAELEALASHEISERYTVDRQSNQLQLNVQE